MKRGSVKRGQLMKGHRSAWAGAYTREPFDAGDPRGILRFVANPKARRAALLALLRTGLVPVNCEGGIGREDPAVRHLARRGLIRFVRRTYGCNPFGHFDIRLTPLRRTYIELVKPDAVRG